MFECKSAGCRLAEQQEQRTDCAGAFLGMVKISWRLKSGLAFMAFNAPGTAVAVVAMLWTTSIVSSWNWSSLGAKVD